MYTPRGTSPTLLSEGSLEALLSLPPLLPPPNMELIDDHMLPPPLSLSLLATPVYMAPPPTG